MERERTAALGERDPAHVGHVDPLDTASRGDRRERAARIDLPGWRDRLDACVATGVRTGVERRSAHRIPAAVNRTAVQRDPEIEVRWQSHRGPVRAADHRAQLERIVRRVLHVVEHHVQPVARGLDVLKPVLRSAVEIRHGPEEAVDIVRDLLVAQPAVADRVGEEQRLDQELVGEELRVGTLGGFSPAADDARADAEWGLERG